MQQHRDFEAQYTFQCAVLKYQGSADGDVCTFLAELCCSKCQISGGEREFFF